MDSLGWGDLSATSGKVPTPNLNQLFQNSVRLNRHYGLYIYIIILLSYRYLYLMAINIFIPVHLMGSPSRTQYLTGRYAMNLGFGEFNSWDDSVLGGIPIGQPTIANWLRDFGDYTTYGVGKWHLGTSICDYIAISILYTLSSE